MIYVLILLVIGNSVLSRQNLVPEHCRNVKSHWLELQYEVLPRKHWIASAEYILHGISNF
jgi:hypothetical protein